MALVRSLNTPYQIDQSENCLVSYSVDIACFMNSNSGESGAVFLEYADDENFQINVVEVCRFNNTNNGSISNSETLIQDITAVLSGFIPYSKYVRMRTLNITGAPIFTWISGQETLL